MKYIASIIVRASDIGLNNNLFGGTLLKWLDEYGALFTYKYLNHAFVTYKMERTYFLKSAKQGDCIDFYIKNLKFNKLSVSFDLVALNGTSEIINTNMTFVAINTITEKPTCLNPLLFAIDEFENWVMQKIAKYITHDETIFHNLTHVENLINELQSIKQITVKQQEYKLLFLAICYHDAIHIVGNKDNEEQSIELFKKDFMKILSEDKIEYVSKLILSTGNKLQENEIKTIKYADLIHDLDMISFIDYETMKNNDVKIRQEHINLSPLEFYTFKLEYLENLLKQDVFISSFYTRYNSIASSNIKKYILEIKEIINKA